MKNVDENRMNITAERIIAISHAEGIRGEWDDDGRDIDRWENDGGRSLSTK